MTRFSADDGAMSSRARRLSELGRDGDKHNNVCRTLGVIGVKIAARCRPDGHQLNTLSPTRVAILSIRRWRAKHPFVRPEPVEGPPTRKRRLSRYVHQPKSFCLTLSCALDLSQMQKLLASRGQQWVFNDQILRPSARGRIRMTHFGQCHLYCLSPSGPSLVFML